MKKKILAMLMAAAMGATLLAGCGSSGSSSSSDSSDTASADGEQKEEDTGDGSTENADDPVVSTYGDENGTHLELWTFVDVHGAFYGKMVDKWNEANPDRKISLTATTYPLRRYA